MLRRAELKHRIRLKELERQQIEQIHNMKVKYFTDISHEIRTPLMLILNPVEKLLKTSSLPPDDRGKVLTIQYYGRRLLLLVNQLLDINPWASWLAVIPWLMWLLSGARWSLWADTIRWKLRQRVFLSALARTWRTLPDRKSTRLNSVTTVSRMPSSA